MDKVKVTQEKKRLLLVDLCSKTPYGVKVNINSPIEEQNQMELFDVNLDSGTIGVRNEKWMFRAIPVENEDGWVVKPYLRPMSSMTEEEERTLDSMCNGVEMVSRLSGLKMFDKAFDWLNAHHFDYRGLIEKGLALEAPEGMYKENV